MLNGWVDGWAMVLMLVWWWCAMELSGLGYTIYGCTPVGTSENAPHPMREAKRIGTRAHDVNLGAPSVRYNSTELGPKSLCGALNVSPPLVFRECFLLSFFPPHPTPG